MRRAERPSSPAVLSLRGCHDEDSDKSTLARRRGTACRSAQLLARSPPTTSTSNIRHSACLPGQQRCAPPCGFPGARTAPAEGGAAKAQVSPFTRRPRFTLRPTRRAPDPDPDPALPWLGGCSFRGDGPPLNTRIKLIPVPAEFRPDASHRYRLRGPLVHPTAPPCRCSYLRLTIRPH